MIVLVWSVVLFGAVHTYAYSFAFLGIFIATVLVVIDNAGKNSETGAIELRILKTPMGPLFLMVLCLLFFQTMPLPDGMLRAISFQSLVIGNKSLPASGLSIPDTANHAFAISPYIYPVHQSIIRWIAYGLLFWGLTQTINTKKRIEIAVFIILITGGLEALYGLGQTYSQSGDILWFSKPPRSKQSVSGTYYQPESFCRPDGNVRTARSRICSCSLPCRKQVRYTTSPKQFQGQARTMAIPGAAG